MYWIETYKWKRSLKKYWTQINCVVSDQVSQSLILKLIIAIAHFLDWYNFCITFDANWAPSFD